MAAGAGAGRSRSGGWIAGITFVAVGTVVSLASIGMFSTASFAAGYIPPDNPPANEAYVGNSDVEAINNARAAEGVAPLSLDANAFDGLSGPEQFFVIFNLERIGRGLAPAVAMTSQLNDAAQQGADNDQDPEAPQQLSGGGYPYGGGGILMAGSTDALASDFVYMYQDGCGPSAPGQTSRNGSCGTDPNASWGHRDIILTVPPTCYSSSGPLPLYMGTAVSYGHVIGGSSAAVIVGDCGPTPNDIVFTWQHAERILGMLPPLVAMAASPDGSGYWLVGADGGVFAYGDAPYLGSMGGQPLAKPIVGIAPTPDGQGYWLVGSDGGVFSFGDAQFYGSTGNLQLAHPVVGMAATPDGRGYWFVASDGGVFAYGDAPFYGSMGAVSLSQPVVGMAPDDATGGYWLVAADGGIFSFNAPFYGSTGNMQLNKPIVGMEAPSDGSGYRFVASDGGVFCFNEPFAGSMGGQQLAAPIVGMAPDGSSAYWLVGSDGGIFAFGGAQYYGSPSG